MPHLLRILVEIPKLVLVQPARIDYEITKAIINKFFKCLNKESKKRYGMVVVRQFDFTLFVDWYYKSAFQAFRKRLFFQNCC